MVSPCAYGPVEVTDLTTVSAGDCAIGVVSSPVQPVLQVLPPVAVAVFSTWPASMSSWVRV